MQRLREKEENEKEQVCVPEVAEETTRLAHRRLKAVTKGLSPHYL